MEGLAQEDGNNIPTKTLEQKRSDTIQKFDTPVKKIKCKSKKGKEEGEERGREKTEIHKYLINNSQKEIWAGFLQNTKF